MIKLEKLGALLGDFYTVHFLTCHTARHKARCTARDDGAYDNFGDIRAAVRCQSPDASKLNSNCADVAEATKSVGSNDLSPSLENINAIK